MGDGFECSPSDIEVYSFNKVELFYVKQLQFVQPIPASWRVEKSVPIICIGILKCTSNKNAVANWIYVPNAVFFVVYYSLF